jgi:hypothetical protein
MNGLLGDKKHWEMAIVPLYNREISLVFLSCFFIIRKPAKLLRKRKRQLNSQDVDLPMLKNIIMM